MGTSEQNCICALDNKSGGTNLFGRINSGILMQAGYPKIGQSWSPISPSCRLILSNYSKCSISDGKSCITNRKIAVRLLVSTL